MLASTFLLPSLVAMAVYALHKFSLIQGSDKDVELHKE
jgi:hypothetical protein